MPPYTESWWIRHGAQRFMSGTGCFNKMHSQSSGIIEAGCCYLAPAFTLRPFSASGPGALTLAQGSSRPAVQLRCGRAISSKLVFVSAAPPWCQCCGFLILAAETVVGFILPVMRPEPLLIGVVCCRQAAQLCLLRRRVPPLRDHPFGPRGPASREGKRMCT